MPAPDSDLVTEFRETNRRLRFWLDHWSAPSAEPSACVDTHERMMGLLSELMRAGASLRALPQARAAGLEQQLAEYRNLVERLRARLPVIHAMLLRERSRLEHERQRLAAAAEWAERSRQTL